LPSYQAHWRIECEARLLLIWDLPHRRRYLEKVNPNRLEALKAEIKRQWEAKRNPG
jgi:hypothetical protein